MYMNIDVIKYYTVVETIKKKISRSRYTAEAI